MLMAFQKHGIMTSIISVKNPPKKPTTGNVPQFFSSAFRLNQLKEKDQKPPLDKHMVATSFHLAFSYLEKKAEKAYYKLD